MSEEIRKLAETAFKQFMNNYMWFADVGMELREIQNNLAEITQKVKSSEKILGMSVGRTAANNGRRGVVAQPIWDEHRHLSGKDLKDIRSSKKLSTTQMSYLLDVARQKYNDWENGRILMTSGVEEKILRIKKADSNFLHEILQQNGVGASVKNPPPSSKRKAKRIPVKTFTRAEIQEVCDVFNWSHRVLGNELGIKYHAVGNWLLKGVHPADDVLERFSELRSKALEVPLQKRQQIKTRATPSPPPRDYAKPEEIRQVLEVLHWTMRELAVYLDVNYPVIWTWKVGQAKPNPEVTRKFRELQAKIASGEIFAAYEGPLAVCDDFINVQKTLNCPLCRFAKLLHMADSRLKKLIEKKSEPTYADTVKIRLLQKKMAAGEVIPVPVCNPISAEQIKEIRSKQHLTQLELSKAVGCSYGIIYPWESGRKCPREPFNSRLWDLWKKPPAVLPDRISGKDIYDFRIKNKISQAKLAEMIGVKGFVIWNLENNHHYPKTKIEEKIKQFFQRYSSETAKCMSVSTEKAPEL